MRMALSPLFGAPPCDEVALWQEAAIYTDKFTGRLPTAEELRSISTNNSLDLATMILYQTILNHPHHQKFIHQLNHISRVQEKTSIPVKLVIIPGLYYKQHPEVGSDGKLFESIAKRLGLEANTIAVKSLGSVTDNVKIISNYLKQQTHQNLWLISSSKGGSEVLRLLHDYRDSPFIAQIKGWINICGITNGTLLADRKIQTQFRRLVHRMLYPMLGLSYQGLQEIAAKDTFWLKPIEYPKHMTMIHIYGIPLLSHIQRFLIGRYNTLKEHGPNDGIIMLRDSMPDQGYIYPLWGADHFFRHPDISDLLYKLFNYVSQAYEQEPVNPSANQLNNDKDEYNEKIHVTYSA